MGTCVLNICNAEEFAELGLNKINTDFTDKTDFAESGTCYHRINGFLREIADLFKQHYLEIRNMIRSNI